jgi:acyl transferase
MDLYDFANHETALADGRRIAMWSLSSSSGARHATPLVLCAGFGRRMHNVSALAAYAAHNGFTTVRYDPVNHVGLSEGSLVDYTMTDGLESLRAAVAWAHAREGRPVGIVASSLTARLAFELAAKDARVAFVVSAVAVVHMRRTIERAIGVDYAGVSASGLPELVTFEGNAVRAERFWRDAHARKWFSFEGTVRALAAARQPITSFIAGDDAWVDSAEVHEAFSLGRGGPRRLHILPRARHEICRDPVIGRTFVLKVTEELLRLAGGGASPVDPPLDAMTEQSLRERNLERVGPDARRCGGAKGRACGLALL